MNFLLNPLKTDHQIKAFITSKDNLEDERSIVENVLLTLNIIPVRVETHAWYATPNPDEFLSQVESCHLVILIIDLNLGNGGDEYYRYVKEEVDLAFKIGKPILAFFKDTSGNAQVIDQFIKETQLKLFHSRFKNCIELTSNLRDSLYNELFREYTNQPQIINSKKGLYVTTCKLINKCKYHLYLSQLTPTFLLGSRTGRTYEENLLTEIKQIIRLQKKDCEIVLLFNKSATDKELKTHVKSYNLNKMFENIDFLKSNLYPNLYISCSNNETVPFVVCDHSYLFGSTGENTSIAISDYNPKVVRELIKQMEPYTTTQQDFGIIQFENLLIKNGIKR